MPACDYTCGVWPDFDNPVGSAPRPRGGRQPVFKCREPDCEHLFIKTDYGYCGISKSQLLPEDEP